MNGCGGKRCRVDNSILMDCQATAETIEEKSTTHDVPSRNAHVFPEITVRVDSPIPSAHNASPILNSGPKNKIASNRDASSQISEKFLSPITPSRGRTGRVKLRRRTLVFTSQEDAPGLYDSLINSSSTIRDLTKQWIDIYIIDKEEAVLSLLQFFISSTGCKGRLTAEMLTNLEIDVVIRRMTEDYGEESAVYPLVASGHQWKRFRENYSKFLQFLVSQCQYSIIYDRFLMDKVVSLLTGLTDSQVRAFRHTATFAAVKLMTAMVNVAVLVSANLANARRQCEAERRKSRENRAIDRVETLTTTCVELVENLDEIKEILGYLFKSVFVHRYTDVVPDIRGFCIAEIGVWMLKFSDHFLDDSHLKYVGWVLHDKIAEVRLRAVEALQPIYASKKFTAKLDFFTRKFKDRIVEMTLDEDPEVAVKAVRLVTMILRNHRDIVTDKNSEDIYELVYSSHREVAHAAGEFLNENLFRGDSRCSTATRTARGKLRSPNTPMIRDLVTFFIEAEVHDHSAYLVDSLLESHEMMKDWECMIDLLLEEAGSGEEKLSDQHEACLIEIMVSCAKQAASGEAPVGRGPARRILTAKKQKQIREDKLRLTEQFIPKLPHLLEKYRADPEKIRNLLVVPQYFDLEIYTTMRLEEHLREFLKVLRDIVGRSHDEEVLTIAAKSLECLCLDGPTITQHCEVARSIILDDIVEKYHEAMGRYSINPSEDSIFDVVHSSKKLSVFFSLHDLNSYEIWDSLSNNLENARGFSGRLPDEALVCCTKACYFSILWTQNNLDNGEIEDRRETIAKRQMENLRAFMETMLHFVEGEENPTGTFSSAVLQDEACISICDCLVLFNDRRTDERSANTRITYEPDDRMQEILGRFMEKRIFAGNPENGLGVETRIERLHGKRNLLAGYCKVLIHSRTSRRAVAEIFMRYLKEYNDYGDIIKATIGRIRDKDRILCARTMLLSLRILYEAMLETTDVARKSSQEFAAIKELAKRFALLFGFDAARNSPALLALHRDGILFAIAPPDGLDRDASRPPVNLGFLDVLAEISYKLVDKDKRTLLNFIDTELETGTRSLLNNEWTSLTHYRNSLSHGAMDQASIAKKSD